MRKDYKPVADELAELDEDGYVEEFWSRQWDGRHESPPSEDVPHREEYRIMQPFLQKLPKGARILDAGCGMGEWTVFLTDLGFDVIGLDVSERTLGRLKDLLPKYNFNVGDIRKTEYADGTFDACFSWGVFEHFERGLSDCIREAARILSPGGFLFVSVPFQNWRHILRDSGPLAAWDELFDSQTGYATDVRFYQWRLTKAELHRELAIADLVVHRVTETSKEHGVHRWMQWDFTWFKEGSLSFRLVRRVFSYILPAKYISHMILAVAQKPPVTS